MITAEPRTPRFPRLVDNDGVVGIRSRESCIDASDLGRRFENDGLVALVLQDVGAGEAGDIKARREGVDAAPGEACAVCGDSNGVFFASCDVADFALPLQSLYNDRAKDVGEGLISALLDNACLAEVVASPCVDTPVFVYGERMIGTGADVNEVVVKAKRMGFERAETGAVIVLTTELVVFAVSPG